MRKTTRTKRNGRKQVTRAAILLLSTTTVLSAVFVSLPKPHVLAAQTVSAQTIEAQDIAAMTQLQLIKEDIVTSGAVLRTYKWHSASANREATDLRVLAIDLNNPHVKLDVMSGRGGQLNSKQSVLGMVRETEAVAGINASFFHMNTSLGNPLGGQIVEQEMTVSPLFLRGWYSFGLTVDRKPVIGDYAFDGSVMSATGEFYELRGINKPLMWDENSVQSHTDSIFMYTPVWGAHERAAGSYNLPTEVLVIDNIVQEISIDAPLVGEIPENGYILRGEGKGAEFLQLHATVGEPIVTTYQMIDRQTGASVDVDQFQMLLGGHSLLVDNGTAASFTTNISNVSGNSLAARSAVGYSADGRYVYLLTADKTSSKNGMTLSDLQQAMIELGVWRGINLDGGGSTTMAARHLGDTAASLVNKPSQSSMRQVVNGIGVYTTAPKGELAGLIMDDMPFLFVGERVSLPVRGYDTYYNPVTAVDLVAEGVNTSVTEGYGTFKNGSFIPTKQGKATITISKGEMKASTDIEIVDRKDIASLEIDAGQAPIRDGSMIELKVTSKLKDGRSREVPSDAIVWHIEGFEGSVADGVLTVEHVDEHAVARLIATYDGLSSLVVLPTMARHLWADFDTIMPPLSVNTLSPGAQIDYTITNEVDGEETTSNILKWSYDYSDIPQYEGDPLPMAAIEFNGGEGVIVDGQPNELLIDVYGDEKSSKLWLEATDINGRLITIPIGTIDWTGWRTVNIDMSSIDMTHPLTMRRLVQESPVNPMPLVDRAFFTEEEVMAMVDPTLTQGELAIDNIVFQSVNYPPEPENKTIEMQINNPSVSVDGILMEIDQAPIIVDGSTMVPIRFVIEAMDGEVAWDPDARKVTLIRGRHYVELWLDEEEMNFNGRKVTAPIAPTTFNSRTMVPVRVLSEQLGWNVKWDGETQSVKLIGRNT